MVIPQEKYFTMRVPFTPPDLEAARKAMDCHKTQFTPEMMQRVVPELTRVWKGAVVAFVPASPAMSGNDLFR
jgi:hypothetical protein